MAELLYLDNASIILVCSLAPSYTSMNICTTGVGLHAIYSKDQFTPRKHVSQFLNTQSGSNKSCV
jgi:hypothetical protein